MRQERWFLRGFFKVSIFFRTYKPNDSTLIQQIVSHYVCVCVSVGWFFHVIQGNQKGERESQMKSKGNGEMRGREEAEGEKKRVLLPYIHPQKTLILDPDLFMPQRITSSSSGRHSESGDRSNTRNTRFCSGSLAEAWRRVWEESEKCMSGSLRASQSVYSGTNTQIHMRPVSDGTHTRLTDWLWNASDSLHTYSHRRCTPPAFLDDILLLSFRSWLWLCPFLLLHAS